MIRRINKEETHTNERLQRCEDDFDVLPPGDNKGAYIKRRRLRPPAKQHLESFAKSITVAYNDGQVDLTFIH